MKLIKYFGILLLSTFIQIGFAQTGTYSGGGDGSTAAKAIYISTTSDLIELSLTPADWELYFKQTADIIFDSDETAVDWNGDGTPDGANTPGFSPIGAKDRSFKGSYNGQDYSIHNLYIKRDAGYLGLFGSTYNAEIKNTSVIDVTIIAPSNTYIGAVCGYCQNALTFENCSSSGDLTGYSDVGGLIGYLGVKNSVISESSSSCNINAFSNGGGAIGSISNPDSNKTSIINCISSGKVTALNNDGNPTFFGGFYGKLYGHIEIINCTASGDVDASIKATDVGGFGGNCSTSSDKPIYMENCSSSGNVISVSATGGTNFTGGFIGTVGNYTTITRCHTTGNVTGPTWTGGFCGRNEGSISNCYTTGQTTGYNTTGGFCGENKEAGSITACYSTGNVSAKENTGGFCGIAKGTIKNCYTHSNVTRLSGTKTTLGAFSGSTGSVSVTENCYATGNVEYTGSTDPTSKGFIGTSTIGATYSNNFWDMEASNQSTATGATGKSTARMKLQSTFTNWDFTDTWQLSNLFNGGYPYLMDIVGNVWIATSSSDWATASNWSLGFVPTATYNATIPDQETDPIISATTQANCYNLSVEHGATLTIKSNVFSTGSLIVTGAADGAVTCERYIASDKYHYFAAPLNLGSTTMKDIETSHNESYMGLQNGDAYDGFFRWIENDIPNNGLWKDLLHFAVGGVSIMDSEPFTKAEAYCYVDGASTGSGDDNTLIFKGAINDVDVSFEAETYTTDGGRGFYIVGNPFTSTIAINTTANPFNNFLAHNADILNASYMAAYIWKEQSDYVGYRDDYQIICNAGFTGVGTGAIFSSNFADVGQGFMIKVKASGDVQFNRSIQKHGTTNFTKNEQEWAGVQLFASSDVAETSTRIGFNEAMSTELDPSFDVGSLMSNAAINLFTQLCSDNSEEPFAIQSLPRTTQTIKCGISVKQPGEYTFSIYQEDMEQVILEDLENGSLVDLLQTPNYAVTLEEGDYISRFLLHLKPKSGNSIENQMLENGLIYLADKHLHIEGLSGTVEVFDISGRVILKRDTVSDNTTISMQEFGSGIYIVRCGTQSTKVML